MKPKILTDFDVLDQAREALDLIERFRNKWGHVWWTPPVADALKFALTEGGEEQRDQVAQALILALGNITTVTFFAGTSFALYVDQALRLNTAYSRNNIKAVTLNANGELVDTVMMVLSALIQVKHHLGTDYRKLLEPIREALYSGLDQGFTSSFEMMYRIARIGMMQEEGDDGWIGETMLLICEILGTLNSEETLAQMIQKRLDRIGLRLTETLDTIKEAA